jgi:hypothetical protein
MNWNIFKRISALEELAQRQDAIIASLCHTIAMQPQVTDPGVIEKELDRIKQEKIRLQKSNYYLKHKDAIKKKYQEPAKVAARKAYAQKYYLEKKAAKGGVS